MTETIFDKTFNLVEDFAEALEKKDTLSNGEFSKNMKAQITPEQDDDIQLKSMKIMGRSSTGSDMPSDKELEQKAKEMGIQLFDLTIKPTLKVLPESEALSMIPNNTDLKEIADELDKQNAPDFAILVRKKAHQNSI